MTDFISRKGEPMTLEEWATAYEDPSIRQVAFDLNVVPRVSVSTIWEGMSLPFRDGIFESVFIIDGKIDHERTRRSYTEEGAILTHAEMVKKAQKEGHSWVPKTR